MEVIPTALGIPLLHVQIETMMISMGVRVKIRRPGPFKSIHLTCFGTPHLNGSHPADPA